MIRADWKILLAGMVCTLGLAASSSAHHSFAVYDRTKTQVLKGTVKAFQWTNPHSVIWIMVLPEGGGEAQEWTIETTSPGVLTRSGWTRKSLNPGDRVAVEFHPLRDGSHGGGLEAVTLLDSGQRLQAKFGTAEKPGSQ